jgi:vang-like
MTMSNHNSNSNITGDRLSSSNSNSMITPLSVQQPPIMNNAVDANNLIIKTSNAQNNDNNKIQINTIGQLMSTKYDDVNNSRRVNSTNYKMVNYSSSNNNNTNTNNSNNNKSFDQLSIVSSQSRVKPHIHHSNSGIIKPSNYTSSRSSSNTNNQYQQRSVNFDNNNKKEPDYDNNNRSRHLNKTSNSIYYDKIYNNNEDNNKIQVQILPQDDNWGANTTAVTADFSDLNDDAMTEDGRSMHSQHFSMNTMKKFDSNVSAGFFASFNRYLNNYFGYLCAILCSICSFLTPILFIIIPRVPYLNQYQLNDCGLECEGLLIGISFKLFILLLGNWALYARKPRSILPRIYELRALIIFLLCIMTFSYWLFYSVRIIGTMEQDYYKILQFTASYVDVLLFIFVISVFILKIRQMQPEYVVKIVRSPDGQQFQYNIGNMSIQRAAVWLLEQYYKDFPVYNHWFDNANKKRALQIQLQFEQQRKVRANGSIKSFNMEKCDNIDEKNNNILTSKKLASRSALLNQNANDRFYEEYEFERRLRKRRARLLTSAEEAFTHIRRVQSNMDPEIEFDIDTETPEKKKITIMDPFEAAQAIFTSIARDLRRYLRVTRQQPYFTRESIVAHLANCISYDMSPKAFLQRFLAAEPIVFNERVAAYNPNDPNTKSNGVGSHGVNYHLNLKTLEQSWILICDTVLYQNIEDNLMIVLKQNDVSLMCTFKRLPKFNLIEDILDPKRNKFVLKLNSETTV